jgi:hypothetical protein
MRQGAGQPEWVVWSTLSKTRPPPPLYCDLDDYASRASTKTQATVRILQHHYDGDANGDGDTATLPISSDQIQGGRAQLPSCISPARNNRFKAVVFTQFPWLIPPLASASALLVSLSANTLR